MAGGGPQAGEDGPTLSEAFRSLWQGHISRRHVMVGFRTIGKVAVCSLAALAGWQARPAAAQFNFDTGNSGIEVIIPAVIPALAQTTSLNDAPIILRHTTLITNA